MVVLVCHAVTSLVTYDRDPDRHHSMVTHSDGGDGSMCSLNIQQQQPQARNVTQLVRCSRPIRKITRLHYFAAATGWQAYHQTIERDIRSLYEPLRDHRTVSVLGIRIVRT